MASFKFHSAKTHSFPDLNPPKSQSNPFPAALPVSGEESQRRRCRHRVFAASPPCSRQLIHRSSDQPRRDVNPADLERWMKGSVEEIVKNLEGGSSASPLVVEVYAGAGKARFKAEKAVPDEWAGLREELERKCPDGLIFVEQLCDGGDCDGGEDGGDRCWGIVIQGRDCAPVCYLLKTCRAAAAAGVELSCTHFCLVKVKSFRESAFGQFKNSWLAK